MTNASGGVSSPQFPVASTSSARASIVSAFGVASLAPTAVHAVVPAAAARRIGVGGVPSLRQRRDEGTHERVPGADRIDDRLALAKRRGVHGDDVAAPVRSGGKRRRSTRKK